MTAMWVALSLLSITITSSLYSSENSRNLLQYPSSYNSWIAPTTPLIPQGIAAAAVGYYNDTIFILGGAYGKRQLITYSISSNKFNEVGTSILPHDIEGYGEFYTQKNEIVYMINPGYDNSTFSTFNTQTLQFTDFWRNTTFPENVGSQGCLAHLDNYLFVIGGIPCQLCPAIRSLQIFNISSNEWLSNIPDMISDRHGGSCIVHKGTKQLYAIGGYADNHTIERIFVGDDLVNISNEQWEIIGSVMIPIDNWSFWGSRAISIGNDIVSIGGLHHRPDAYAVDHVTVIDATTNVIRSGGYLDYGSYWHSLVNVDDQVVYLFGGCISNSWCGGMNRKNQWQYKYLIPTKDPTTTPTAYPTSDPSTNPTTYPTTYPTTNPTTYPTLNPTTYPTSDPTLDPTMDPTNVPTFTTIQTETESNNGIDSNMIIIIVLIGVIVIILVILVVVLVIVKKYVLNKQIINNNEHINVYNTSNNQKVVHVANNTEQEQIELNDDATPINDDDDGIVAISTETVNTFPN